MNPKELSALALERLSRGFVDMMSDFIGPETDIPAPDVYTDPCSDLDSDSAFARLSNQTYVKTR